MCEGVESDQPGDCPKCGMAPERNPAYAPSAKTIWTCPMHPEIKQDHPGACPICGMNLEPIGGAAEDEDEQREIPQLRLKLWVSVALSLPLLLIAMGEMFGLAVGDWIPPHVQGWIELALATPVVVWAGGMFSRGAGVRSSIGT